MDRYPCLCCSLSPLLTSAKNVPSSLNHHSHLHNIHFKLSCTLRSTYHPIRQMAPIIPFSEPPYLAGLPSPYYSSSHLSWQKACRAFLQENFIEHAMDWEREGDVPPEVFRKFAAANMLVPSLPAPLPVQWLKRLGVHDILGVVKVEDWDYLHTAIFADEVCFFALIERLED